MIDFSPQLPDPQQKGIWMGGLDLNRIFLINNNSKILFFACKYDPRPLILFLTQQFNHHLNNQKTYLYSSFIIPLIKKQQLQVQTPCPYSH
jgi:hypothetical protein